MVLLYNHAVFFAQEMKQERLLQHHFSDKIDEFEKPIRYVVFGEYAGGKSSLVKAYFDLELSEERTYQNHKAIDYYCYGDYDHEKRMDDSLCYCYRAAKQLQNVEVIDVPADFLVEGHPHFSLVEHLIEEADFCIGLIPVAAAEQKMALQFLKRIKSLRKERLLFVINQIDLKSFRVKEIIELVAQELEASFQYPIPVLGMSTARLKDSKLNQEQATRFFEMSGVRDLEQALVQVSATLDSRWEVCYAFLLKIYEVLNGIHPKLQQEMNYFDKQSLCINQFDTDLQQIEAQVEKHYNDGYMGLKDCYEAWVNQILDSIKTKLSFFKVIKQIFFGSSLMGSLRVEVSASLQFAMLKELDAYLDLLQARCSHYLEQQRVVIQNYFNLELKDQSSFQSYMVEMKHKANQAVENALDDFHFQISLHQYLDPAIRKRNRLLKWLLSSVFILLIIASLLGMQHLNHFAVLALGLASFVFFTMLTIHFNQKATILKQAKLAFTDHESAFLNVFKTAYPKTMHQYVQSFKDFIKPVYDVFLTIKQKKEVLKQQWLLMEKSYSELLEEFKQSR